MSLRFDTFSAPVALTTPDGERVATAFICAIPFDSGTTAQRLAHVYIATALHCVYDFEAHTYREIQIESSWMGGQPLARHALDPTKWVNFAMDELPIDEDWVDIAVQPFTVDSYSGHVIGHASVAVQPSSMAPEVAARQDNTMIGVETATIGLFHYYSGGRDQLEPIVRFGRFLHVPHLPIDGARGKMRAYLVESLASSGMSGSPVFVDGETFGTTDAALLGVHVGHAPARKSTAHSGVSVITPASRLVELLARADLVEQRRQVEAEHARSPWRFRDRRHRRRNGVAFQEERFLDLADYEEEHPFRHDYLIARIDEDAQDPAIYDQVDYWNEWRVHTPMGTSAEVRATLEAYGSLRWSVRGSVISGWGTWGTGEEAVVSLHLHEGAVEMIVLELESELDDEALGALTTELRGNHYVVARRDDVNWIPGPVDRNLASPLAPDPEGSAN